MVDRRPLVRRVRHRLGRVPFVVRVHSAVVAGWARAWSSVLRRVPFDRYPAPAAVI